MLRPNCLKFTFSLKKAPLTLFPMGNWKKCRFNFQTYLHPNQDYSETVKDISSEKIRHLENSILHNQPVTKLAPLPQGGRKEIREKMCKTFARHCTQYKCYYSFPQSKVSKRVIPVSSMVNVEQNANMSITKLHHMHHDVVVCTVQNDQIGSDCSLPT